METVLKGKSSKNVMCEKGKSEGNEEGKVDKNSDKGKPGEGKINMGKTWDCGGREVRGKGATGKLGEGRGRGMGRQMRGNKSEGSDKGVSEGMEAWRRKKW